MMQRDSRFPLRSAAMHAFTQAIRNVNDGLSALAVAEGSLAELSAISMRQSGLATQAANGVYTLDQRRALTSEANALVDEYNRIIASKNAEIFEELLQLRLDLDASSGFDPPLTRSAGS